MRDDDALQTSAVDPEQLAHAAAVTTRREDRRASLWRWLLSTHEGREWLYDVGLEDLGYLHHIGGAIEQVYTEAALHNLCCRWMAEVHGHPDLFLQMQREGMTRRERIRQENRASRVRRARKPR
jgi:hypothetical protein